MTCAFRPRRATVVSAHDEPTDRSPAPRAVSPAATRSAPAPAFGHQIGQVSVQSGPAIARADRGFSEPDPLPPLDGMMDPMGPAGGFGGQAGGFAGPSAYPGMTPLPMQPVPGSPFAGMTNPFAGVGNLLSGFGSIFGGGGGGGGIDMGVPGLPSPMPTGNPFGGIPNPFGGGFDPSWAIL